MPASMLVERTAAQAINAVFWKVFMGVPFLNSGFERSRPVVCLERLCEKTIWYQII
jgi:hypothetical protein